MPACIQEDGLRSRINTACCRYRRIEAYGKIYVELILYHARRILSIIHDNDGKRYLIPISFCKRFEIRDIEAGAGTVGIEEM